ncbi:MAG: hypothetical protein F6K09_00265 [Merismopedia sp. SIO2A8]|nr:hypothetical protein [Merismopedia sp. SIO2A8]
MPQFLNKNIQQAFWSPVETWLTAHPTVNWLIAHPTLLALVGLITLLFLAGLISALARLTENLWLRFLQLPFRLVWGLVQMISAGVQRITTRTRVSKSEVILIDTPVAKSEGMNCRTR